MLFDYDFRNYSSAWLAYMTALSVIGILVVRSATNMDSEAVTKQMFGILAGMAIAVCLSLVDYHKIPEFPARSFIRSASEAFWPCCFGADPSIMQNAGSRFLFWDSSSPSEFVKIGPYHHLLLVFYEISGEGRQGFYRGTGGSAFAVPAMLIFEQPNLSTCLVTVVIVLGIVFASGISYRWIVGTLAVVIPMIATGMYLLLHGMIPFIKEYQAGRILAWFYPEQYGEARYQQNNSIIAIGSGQLHGKGFTTLRLHL